MRAVRVTAITLVIVILAVLSGCRKLSPADTIRYTADDSYYLQDSDESDLYLLKDGFETELERLGLIGKTELLVAP